MRFDGRSGDAMASVWGCLATVFRKLAVGPLSVATAIVTLGVLAFLSAKPAKPEGWDFSYVAAFCVLLLAAGIVMCGPTLLREGGPESPVSTMRVVLYGVFTLFAMLMVKADWNCPSLEAIHIDTGLATILSVLAGAKAVQSLGEPATTMTAAPAVASAAKPLPPIDDAMAKAPPP
jgi:hypothetical protein